MDSPRCWAGKWPQRSPAGGVPAGEPAGLGPAQGSAARTRGGSPPAGPARPPRPGPAAGGEPEPAAHGGRPGRPSDGDGPLAGHAQGSACCWPPMPAARVIRGHRISEPERRQLGGSGAVRADVSGIHTGGWRARPPKGSADAAGQNLTCPLLNLTPGAFIVWT